MLSIIHGASWLLYTGPVFGLGPSETHLCECRVRAVHTCRWYDDITNMLN
jgi:hypothetical protein